jgi:hypothetical protein
MFQRNAVAARAADAPDDEIDEEDDVAASELGPEVVERLFEDEDGDEILPGEPMI